MDKSWLADFVTPFRVSRARRSCSAATSTRAFKRGVEEAATAASCSREGIEQLAEYQDRLAAQDTLRRPRRPAGAGRRGQGRDDPPRDERGEPAGRRGAQLQGALHRGARPRLPLALRAAAARARRDRHLQPLALRGGPRRPRAPGAPRAAEAAARRARRTASGSAATGRSTTGSAT